MIRYKQLDLPQPLAAVKTIDHINVFKYLDIFSLNLDYSNISYVITDNFEVNVL